jgi:hypothetical protein
MVRLRELDVRELTPPWGFPMIDLHDMTIWQRVLVMIAIIVFALLVVFAAEFWSEEAPVAAPIPGPLPELQRSQYDERLLTIDREAIEAAYREQVQHLFAVWMKDDTGQPLRVITGVRKAAKAYIESMDGAARREQEIRGNK